MKLKKWVIQLLALLSAGLLVSSPMIILSLLIYKVSNFYIIYGLTLFLLLFIRVLSNNDEIVIHYEDEPDKDYWKTAEELEVGEYGYCIPEFIDELKNPKTFKLVEFGNTIKNCRVTKIGLNEYSVKNI